MIVSRNRSVYHAAAAALIILVGIAAYAGSLRNGFVYNDYQMVVTNPFIRTFENFGDLFSEAYFTVSREGTYRPFVTFTFMADYQLWGGRPFGYHLTNLVFHLLNGLLLYGLLNIIAGYFREPDKGPSSWPVGARLLLTLGGALLFVANPVCSEGVLSIGSRHDMVMSFFYLAAMTAFLLSREKRRGGGLYVLSLVFFFLSLFSKEMGITLPVVLLLVDIAAGYARGLGEKGILLTLRGRLLSYSGLLAVTFVYLVIRFFIIKHPVDTMGDYYDTGLMFGGTYITHLMTVCSVYGLYLRLMFFPWVLSLEYPVSPVLSAADPVFLMSITAVVTVVAGALLARKRHSLYFLGWGWFFVTLLPVSNMFMLLQGTRVSERFLYLPAAGFCVFLGAFAGNIFKRAGVRGRKALLLGMSALILSFTLRTALRTGDWRDNETFWKAESGTEFKSFRTHNNLAMEFYYSGRVDEAIEQLEISLKLDDRAQTHVNLGFIYLETGALEKAEKEFSRAIEVDPGYAPAYYHMGLLMMARGKDDAAGEYVERAIRSYERMKFRPFYAEALNAGGYLAMQKGSYSRAADLFREALSVRPDFGEAGKNLAEALYLKGDTREAIEQYSALLAVEPEDREIKKALGRAYFAAGEYERARDLYAELVSGGSDDHEARYMLGNSYMKLGLPARAEREYMKALEEDPADVKVMNNLGNIFFSRGDAETASGYYRKALEIAPSFSQARNNLANLYLASGAYDEAIEEYERILREHGPSAVVRYNLGLAFRGKGMREEALRNWEGSIRLDPGFQPARDALREMGQSMPEDAREVGSE